MSETTKSWEEEFDKKFYYDKKVDILVDRKDELRNFIRTLLEEERMKYAPEHLPAQVRIFAFDEKRCSDKVKAQCADELEERFNSLKVGGLMEIDNLIKKWRGKE